MISDKYVIHFQFPAMSVVDGSILNSPLNKRGPANHFARPLQHLKNILDLRYICKYLYRYKMIVELLRSNGINYVCCINSRPIVTKVFSFVCTISLSSISNVESIVHTRNITINYIFTLISKCNSNR